MRLKKVRQTGLSVVLIMGLGAALAGCGTSAKDTQSSLSAVSAESTGTQALSGTGSESMTDAVSVSSGTEKTSDEEELPVSSVSSGSSDMQEPYADFAMTYVFSSGAGAWSTELELQPDGSFTGYYHDMDMGDTGDEYPDGTMYECHFSGKFNPPQQLDDLTWTMTLESLVTGEDENAVSIEDGVRHIGSVPYGISDTESFQILLPGSDISDNPDLQSWLRTYVGDSDMTAIPCYCLYNVDQKEGFCGSKDQTAGGLSEVSADTALASLRSAADASGNVCAVIDLGYYPDSAADSTNIEGYGNYTDKVSVYPFIADIPEDRIIGSEVSGCNAFCFVPADPEAEVQVYSTDGPQDDGTLARGSLLYSAGDGDPVIVRCVVGDFFSNVLITVTDSSGQSVIDYNPMYSGEDGSLIITDAAGNSLYEAM